MAFKSYKYNIEYIQETDHMSNCVLYVTMSYCSYFGFFWDIFIHSFIHFFLPSFLPSSRTVQHNTEIEIKDNIVLRIKT